MPYMQMTEEQFKVPVLKNVIYALRLVWQTDKRLLIGYLLQEGLYAVFSRYLQNINRHSKAGSLDPAYR